MWAGVVRQHPPTSLAPASIHAPATSVGNRPVPVHTRAAAFHSSPLLG